MRIFVTTSLKTLLILSLTLSLTAFDWPWVSERQRGDSDYYNRQYYEAAEHYRTSIDRDGHDWQILYNLGTAYYYNGNWEGAVEELSYALQVGEEEDISPARHAMTLHNLGLAYLQLDECDPAVNYLEQAAQADENNEDIAANLAFAQQYCAEMPPENPDDEGEDENEGEGDKQDENEGQSDESQNNDETETQNDADSEEGDEEEGSDSESEGDQDGSEDDQDEDQPDESEGEEEQETEEPDRESEGDQAGESEGEDEADMDGESDDTGNSPREIPDDGLRLSDQQIEELLEYMRHNERRNAPRNFNNNFGDGEYMDDENWVDLLQKLLFGLPMNSSPEEPDDGIDW